MSVGLIFGGIVQGGIVGRIADLGGGGVELQEYFDNVRLHLGFDGQLKWQMPWVVMVVASRGGLE